MQAGSHYWYGYSSGSADATVSGAEIFRANARGGVTINDGQNSNINFIAKAGSSANAFQIDGSSGAITINEASADADFRIESNNDDAVFFVDAGNDRVILGHNSARTNFFDGAYGSALQIETLATANRYVSMSAVTNSNDSNGGYIVVGKTRGTSVGSNTIVASGDTLGSISWQGSDGTHMQAAADIYATVNGTPGANNLGGELNFRTSAAGGITRTIGIKLTHDHYTKMTSDGNFYSATSDYHEMGQHLSTSFGTVFWNGHTTSTNYTMFLDHKNNADDNTSLYFGAYTNASYRIKMFSDGDIQNHDNSYSALSDEKLKQDIEDASSQWNDIKNLQVRKFKWKSKPEKGYYLGLIAQEAEKVSPGLVRETEDIGPANEDGGIEKFGTTTKTLKYSVLYMKAVKALQEAMTRIETLESDVKGLKGE